jgi:spermidine synthase
VSEWFVEKEENSLSFGYKVEKKIFSKKSLFQQVDIYKTVAYGNMLVIDNYVMMTDADEFVYHEVISHIPVCYHKDPKSVLVVGGGDGGTLRELSKHEGIERIVLCEIDQLVLDVSKKHFPKVACGLSHPKVEVKIADGIEYIKNHKNCFDIVVVDSTDPIGPGEGLFTADFYRSVKESLKADGMVVVQSESPWYKQEFVKGIYQKLGKSFRTVLPYIAPIPTYPRGLWSWTIASNLSQKDMIFNENRFSKVEKSLNYLTKETAHNIFVIPPFLRKKLNI